MSETKRVLIWSGWARIGHWSIALSCMALIITGYLMNNSPVLAKDSMDAHYIAAPLLIIGLVIRFALFFSDNRHLKISYLLPSAKDMKGIKSMLLFYLSFGRQPLPGWYAQNPFWKPIYLIWYSALLLLIISGLNMPDSNIVLSFYPLSVHRYMAEFVLWLTILHLVSIFMHDYRGNADCSGMINGYRTFDYETNSQKDTTTVIHTPIINVSNKEH